jgi:hypothetical protein
LGVGCGGVGFCLSGRKIRSRVFGFSSSFATSTPGAVGLTLFGYQRYFDMQIGYRKRIIGFCFEAW